ncbi:zinc carboxypeptidase [Desmospora activa DSM 45169]|uniref:Zinc carboxypeptidase n=1 Tax=Desmospora activa DSM 45169 TaxID=1121389 RepID=A0A2T4Z941_9BACL|nr:zinc carboxypeptidase [Desmospora activa DSM 45169]
MTACLHGNEYTGFYALAQFLDLLVRRWREYPQLSYLRKNVRLITIPIVNPWGFNQGRRQNANQVDLNRNFPYNWDLFANGQPGDTNYKGPSPMSEVEAEHLDALFNEFNDAVAYLDFHTIISVAAEYVMFVPRWLRQNNSRWARVVQEMHDPDRDRIAWGTSTLPAATNYARQQYGFNVGLPEFYNGLFGSQHRDSAEMTQAVKWFGNMILQGTMISAQATVETLKDPTMKWYAYDESPGSLFGEDGDYEGTPGESVPVNRVNHSQLSTKTYSTDYTVFGQTSMKMVADNQATNGSINLTELTSGTYWLWTLYRQVTEISDGHFGMYVYNYNSSDNLETVVPNRTSPDSDWVRVGGVFQGRSGGCRLVYGRTVAWTGTVYVDGNMLVQLSEKEYNDYIEGKISLEQLMDKYQFPYEKEPDRIAVNSRNYSTVLQTVQQFTVETPGVVSVDGFVTFTLSQEAEVGFIPLAYQPFAAEFNWGDGNANPLYEIRRRFPAGTHTLPLYGQMYAVPTSKRISNRSGDLTIRLRAMRSTGMLTINQYRLRVTFLPAAPGLEMYDATKRESLSSSAMQKVYPVPRADDEE